MRKVIGAGLLVVLSSSCNKEISPGHNLCAGDVRTIYITSIDLQSCKYKPNSYWVYIDSISNIIDSVSIESFNQDFVVDVCGNSYQSHSFRKISSYSSFVSDYIIVAGGLFEGYDGTTGSGTNIYDDFHTATSWSNHQIEKYDSLFIYDRYYHKVLRVQVENDYTESNNTSVYFNNSEFGFLKHEIYSDTILISQKVLMRKNIVR